MVQKRIYNYFERNPQLHVLFVFDRMNIIMSELEECTWEENYVYKVFDGAWFNTKYNIEYTWKDKNVILLFPLGTYPATEELQLKFPLLDMLKANMEYKDEDYAAFMQQYNLPEKYRSFISRNIAELMSSKAYTMLKDHFTPEAFSEDVVSRGFISTYFGDKKLLSWESIFVRLTILGLASEEKKRRDFFRKLEQNRDTRKLLDEKLKKIFGFSFNANTLVKVKELVECIKYNSITQLLDVSASDNYKSYKITSSIALEQINRIYELGTRDNSYSDKFTATLNELGADIKESEIIAAYGINANYYYLTQKLCWPILQEVVSHKLVADSAKTYEYIRQLSQKFPTGSDVQIVIGFIEQVALYYDKVKGIGTLKLNTPEEYVQMYINSLYQVDTFYRKALESYHLLITKDIPILDALNESKKQLDIEYAKICNVLNLEWLTCVTERKDYFDSISLKKQEDFYNNECGSNVKQVIIISDALRYEVANELILELSKEKHIAKLSAYRAMLPSETKYCKLALLPKNTLEWTGKEMFVDGDSLTTIESRSAHLAKYKDGAICVKYEDVMNSDQKAARELFKRPLVYIFHDTIDNASHGQNTFDVISACRNAIEQLSVLIKRLHATWNVSNVILTSDHGFIYNDIVFEDKDKHSVLANNVIEKKTRYYISNGNEEQEGIITMPLNRVSGIKADDTVFVGLPIGTNRLAAAGGYNFAHGGATLQEMIIPVIHSTLKRVDKSEKVGVGLLNHNLMMVSSRVKFKLIQSEAVSMTLMERKVVCCVYDGDIEVTNKETITLNSTDSTSLDNRSFDVVLNLNKSVTSNMLQLRVYDEDDKLNPLIRETVKNNTMIEQDF